MMELQRKIENYEELIDEHIKAGRIADAAMNIRHVLELVLNSYVERYAPEYIYGKAIDKIDSLHEKRIIDRITVNTFHHLRKLSNKAAHGDEVSTDELQKAIPAMEFEIKKFFEKIAANQDVEKEEKIESGEQEEKEVFDEVRISALLEIANTTREIHGLMVMLDQYSDEAAQVYKEKCKVKREILWKKEHEVEIELEEIRKRNSIVNNIIVVFGNSILVRSVFKGFCGVAITKDDKVRLNAIKTVMSWNNVNKIYVINDKVFAVFRNGKVGVKECSLYHTEEYLIRDYIYGEWDDIVDVASNGETIYGVTREGRVRIFGYDKHGIEWDKIKKIFVDPKNTNILVGLKKDGTIIIDRKESFEEILETTRDNYISPYLNLEELDNALDVKFSNSKIIVLTKDGNVYVSDDCSDKLSWMREVSNWKEIIQIAVSNTHIVGLKKDGTVVETHSNEVSVRRDCYDVMGWKNIVAVYTDTNLTIGLTMDGRIVSCGKSAELYRGRICYNVFNFTQESRCWKIRADIIKEKNVALEEKEKIEKEREIIQERLVGYTSFFDRKEKLQCQQQLQSIEEKLLNIEYKLETLEKNICELNKVLE